MSGWIVLARGWRDDEAFDESGPLSEREAWVWLIEKAAWKTCHRRNAKGERITVERGQFHTSLRNLSTAFGWGKNKVSRYLDKLAGFRLIGTVTGQSGCMITICNYAKYQDQKETDEAAAGTVAGQSRDTQEQGKQDIPIPNGIGVANSEKQFWDSAVAYIGDRGKVAKLLKGRKREDVAAAITEAQLAGAVDPFPYVLKVLNRQQKSAEEMPVC